MRQVLAVGVVMMLAATAAAEAPSVTVPIAPAPAPVQSAPSAPPLDLTPNVPDAKALSQINPTAGPIAPHKAAIRPVQQPPRHTLPMSDPEQRRETRALNWLAAAGYGRFHDLRRRGRDYQVTIDGTAGSYTVTIDPDTGRITPASAAADRETQALNLLATRGYLEVNAIRPAGANFIATVRQDGRPVDVEVDRARGQITQRN